MSWNSKIWNRLTSVSVLSPTCRLELSGGPTQAPKSLTVINEAGIGRQVALPEALRGVIHFPIVEDEELVMLLRDPDSEVYLA